MVKTWQKAFDLNIIGELLFYQLACIQSYNLSQCNINVWRERPTMCDGRGQQCVTGEANNGCVSTEKWFNQIISCRGIQRSFCLKPIDIFTPIYSCKASFSGIVPAETHNNRINITISRRWLSVQEFPDMVEAEFYLGQFVQSMCVCVLWKQKRLSDSLQDKQIKPLFLWKHAQ